MLGHPVTGQKAVNLIIAGVAGSFLASRVSKRGMKFTLAVGVVIPLAILAVNKLTEEATEITTDAVGSTNNPTGTGSTP